ncbi:MAG: LON peptidase substrate-binding domain-containing protein [Phycisphaerales bacterium]|nr:LON peptidase substrate-binding domain-containing protein [Phycisphaerales bacterium]MCI0631843.1 LON peptidase substrate-binding domain-containing protein [Phycisphaerales bacterium]MCI0676655.1 LON peptidase substrate-binding domain-containing protein [Phycisphaerales bacterium]
MTEVIRVNFSKPMPLFPLPDAVLLPHAVQPLHIFEPRYQQMISDCLDQSGQVAMATFKGENWKLDYEGTPPLRPAVCVGQIVHHDELSDGRHNILLHGVCRARIQKLIEPTDDRPYRMARLSPLEAVEEEPPAMNNVRKALRSMLISPRLSRMRSVETVMQWFDRKDVSTHALLELIGFALVHDSELKYRLLAEANPLRRARLIKQELTNLDHLVLRAERQAFRSWPKGLSWN